MADTSIEWTDKAWNVLRGCSRVSPGCVHCYAERQAARFSGPGQPYEGLVRISAKADGRREPRWTGAIRFVPEKLAEPISWRKPCRVFVNSMSDLFHEGVTDEQIAAIFGVMAVCPQHTFQVLTKRPERARAWFAWVERQTDRGPGFAALHPIGVLLHHAQRFCDHVGVRFVDEALARPWPLPNVWLGVSVEDQATADERIPLLLDTPAAIRWVSYEPALGPVDWKNIASDRAEMMLPLAGLTWSVDAHAPRLVRTHSKIDWIVIGGESGPGARPFDLAWARSTIAQCREAAVPCFVKQLGAKPHDGELRSVVDRYGRVCPSLSPEDAARIAPGYDDGRVEPAWLRLKSKKGSDPAEWTEGLAVREMPEVRRG